MKYSRIWPRQARIEGSRTRRDGLIEWLERAAAERIASAKTRREGLNPNATAAELRNDKKMAEHMFGRKLDLVKTDVKSNKESCAIQERIADKLENEALKLSGWAESLKLAKAAREGQAPTLGFVEWHAKQSNAWPTSSPMQICDVIHWAERYGAYRANCAWEGQAPKGDD